MWADCAEKRTAPLKVESADNRGAPVAADVCNERMKRAFRLAQTIWNELDQKKEPIFRIE